MLQVDYHLIVPDLGTVPFEILKCNLENFQKASKWFLRPQEHKYAHGHIPLKLF